MRPVENNPSQDELRYMVIHVCYEAVALEVARNNLLATKGQERAFDIEACCLHLRTLRDFLWEPKRKDATAAYKAVYARHYLPSGIDVRMTCPGSVTGLHDAINGQVAHLSTLRIKQGKYRDLTAQAPRAANDLLKCWDGFRQELRTTHWAANFDDAERRVRRRAPRTPSP